MRCLKNHFRQGAKIQWFPLVSAAWKDELSFTFTKTVILFKSCRGRSNTTRRPQAHYFLDLLALFLELFLPVDLGQHVGIPKLFPFSHQWERLLSTLRTIAIVPGTETPATTKKTFARPCTLNLTGVKLHCGLKRLLIGHLLSNADDKKLVWINSHKHAMLTQCGAWTLMRSEADTWPQSLPGLPLAALTVTSSKAASRDRGLTLPFPPPQKSSSAWLLGVRTSGLLTTFSCPMSGLPQLLSQRANLLSKLHSLLFVRPAQRFWHSQCQAINPKSDPADFPLILFAVFFRTRSLKRATEHLKDKRWCVLVLYQSNQR